VQATSSGRTKILGTKTRSGSQTIS
jgi:hypothetical protein